MRHLGRKALIVILCIAGILAAAFGLYVSDYYHANDAALAAMADSDTISIQKNQDSSVTFTPSKSSDIGVIFYPGGKVENTAYAPLLRKYAEKGITCELLKMPFNLAVFDINAADRINRNKVTHWYIAGHSLGGAMAAVYASKHAEELDGLILLGAYSTEDLSDTNLKVILIDGSNDQIINQKRAEESLSNYPDSTYSFTIEGGNHSQFGSYGHQKGDGVSTITADEQWDETVEDTLEIMQK